MVWSIVRVFVWAGAAARIVGAASLGHDQRQAFEFWRRQQSHKLSSRQVTSTDCVSATPAEGLTERLQGLLTQGGEGYVLSLCPNTTYPTDKIIEFTAPRQEISTAGYPIDDSRAILRVNGSTVDNGTGHTAAIGGGCGTCKEIKIRNIQIDGNRRGAPPITGGANIEIGGPAGDQLVEYVKSYDPRSWSCLHVAEGVLDCSNSTIRYNDIGPCGSDTFAHWADGISLSCRNSYVHDNWIKDPTDGGIVIFQSPGSHIVNNTIWIENNTCLGGINLVDYDPFSGDYTGVMVLNNTVVGGYADAASPTNPNYGNSSENAIIKMGIPVGLKPWFGSKWGTAVAFGGSVINNTLSGAFGYGIPVSGVRNFTVTGNTLSGNTSFVGTRGPNCTAQDIMPPAVDFVADPNAITSSTVMGFKLHGITTLLCTIPPRGGGSIWPLGTAPNASLPTNETLSGAMASFGQGSTLQASTWCQAGETKGACARRFASALMGFSVKIVPDSR